MLLAGAALPVAIVALYTIRRATRDEQAAVRAQQRSLATAAAWIVAGELRRRRIGPPARPLTGDERESALRPLAERLARIGRAGRLNVRIVDPAGRTVLGAQPGSARHVGLGVLVPDSTWRVVVDEGLDSASALVRRTRMQAWLWLGVASLLSLAVGQLLAGGLLASLRRASTRLSAERFGSAGLAGPPRAPAPKDPRTGELGAALEAMEQAVEERRGKSHESIAVLERRIEASTKHLHEAGDQFVRTRVVGATADLAAHVAREIDAPLGEILGAIHALLASAETDAPLVPHLKDIEREAMRIRSILLNLLQLTPAEAGPEQRRIDVNEVVTRTIALLELDLEAQNVVVEQHVGENLPPIGGDSLEISRAIVEVVKNAQSAMAQGGKLVVSTSVADARTVQIAIRDSGKGISREHLERIFDPFFTTKDDWRDIGLGLALVQKIVERQSGRVHVESEEGKGTTVRMTFPALSEAPRR